MRLLFALLAAAGLAGLTGCVAYGGGVAVGTDAYYGQSYGYYNAPSYGTYGYTSPYYGRGNRDRDGDGVPNRYDRAPDNPRRY